jgi:uncharacterized protein YxjI
MTPTEPNVTDRTAKSIRPPAGARTGETYTVRRKMMRLFGAAFHVIDSSGDVIGFCDQKGFRLREDIRVYTDESKQTLLFRLRTRSIIDFGATYEILLEGGEVLGSLRRKGIKSSFVRDEWSIVDHHGREAGKIHELNQLAAILRRISDGISLISPQRYAVVDAQGTTVATFRQHLNPFVFTMGVTIAEPDHAVIDELVILAAACIIGALEGRE